MPRISRQKAAKRHAPAVQLPSRRSFAVSEELVEPVLPGSKEIEAGPSTKGLKFPSNPNPESLPSHPYSRSHARREKRKARQQLAGGQLHDIAAALSESLGESEETARVRTKEEKDREREKIVEGNKVGRGKGRTLREKKRRKEIATEAKRLPAIASHPIFKQNPWETIRLHAANSIALKEKP